MNLLALFVSIYLPRKLKGVKKNAELEGWDSEITLTAYVKQLYPPVVSLP